MNKSATVNAADLNNEIGVRNRNDCIDTRTTLKVFFIFRRAGFVSRLDSKSLLGVVMIVIAMASAKTNPNAGRCTHLYCCATRERLNERKRGFIGHWVKDVVHLTLRSNIKHCMSH